MSTARKSHAPGLRKSPMHPVNIGQSTAATTTSLQMGLGVQKLHVGTRKRARASIDINSARENRPRGTVSDQQILFPQPGTNDWQSATRHCEFSKNRLR